MRWSFLQLGVVTVLTAAAAGCSSDPANARGSLDHDGGASTDPGTGGSGAGGSGTTTPGGGNTGGSAGSSTGFTVSDASPDTSKKEDACGSMKVGAEIQTMTTETKVPGNVLFVFDQSGSMNDKWNNTSKIQTAIDAINAAFMPVADQLSAGAIFFPDTNAEAGGGCNWATDWLTCLTGGGGGGLGGCPDVSPIGTPPQIPIQPGPAFLTAWNNYWAPPVAAKGAGTPTEKGMLAGAAALATPPPGNTVMILVTDGQPTCGSNESAPAAQLLQMGIKTYVIGLPGSAGTTVLDNVAIAGGTAPMGCTSNCYTSPDDAMGLQTVLGSIATDIVMTTTVVSIKNCDFTLDPPDGGNPSDVHLVVTDAKTGQQYEVPQMMGDGWTLSSRQPDGHAGRLRVRRRESGRVLELRLFLRLRHGAAVAGQVVAHAPTRAS